MTDMMGSVDLTADGATIRFERVLAAPPERVWAALTDEALLAGWLTSGTFEAAMGGALALDFGEGGVVSGQISAFEPPRKLAYSWLIEGEQASTVEWTLMERGSGTQLTLVHRTLPSAMGRGYGAGWHAYLERLDAVASGAEPPGFDERFEALLGDYAG